MKNEQLVQLMLHEPLAPVRPVASLWRMFSAGYDWAYDIPVQTPTPPSPPLLPVLAPHARDTLNLAIGAILEATTDEDTDEDCLEAFVLVVFDICIRLRSLGEASPNTPLASNMQVTRRRRAICETNATKSCRKYTRNVEVFGCVYQILTNGKPT